MSFGNEAWSEDLKTFDSYTSPTEAIDVYLRPLLSFSSILEYFVSKNLVRRGMPITNFGVSTTILNQVDIFCWWYKLNFGLLQGQVKSYHFHEKIEAKKYFYFLYVFL